LDGPYGVLKVMEVSTVLDLEGDGVGSPSGGVAETEAAHCIWHADHEHQQRCARSR
jgi:hypothetical protein